MGAVASLQASWEAAPTSSCSSRVWTPATLPSQVRLAIDTAFPTLCDGIEHDYFMSALTDEATTHVIVAGHEGDRVASTKVCGVVLLQQRPFELYISLICARGGPRGTGTALLSRAVDLARKLAVSRITLSAVPAAVTFYQRYGFRLDNPGTSGESMQYEEQPMTYWLESKQERRARKQRDARRLARQVVQLQSDVDAMRQQAKKLIRRIQAGDRQIAQLERRMGPLGRKMLHAGRPEYE